MVDDAINKRRVQFSDRQRGEDAVKVQRRAVAVAAFIGGNHADGMLAIHQPQQIGSR
ncbi:hypothetical protein D3C80_1860250 [compost metagenome]